MPDSHRAPVSIVDDDQAALSSLRFLLESEGFSVASYGSGAELLNSPDLPRSSCFVIDVKMPGMDGIAVSRRLRELGTEAPVVLITGHPDPAIQATADRAGLRLVEKPLSQERLLCVLRSVADARAG